MGPVVEWVQFCIKYGSEQQYWSNTTLCHVRMQSNATCGLGVPYPLCREENNVPLDWGHDGRETTSLQEYERNAKRKFEVEHSDVQALDTGYPSQMFSVDFDPRIIPGISHKLRFFLAEPYRVMKLIAPALAEI